MIKVGRSSEQGRPAVSENISSGSFRRLVSGLVAPATVTTAALYYFGWLRSQTIARQFGYDASLLGLSGSDLILRAVQPVASLFIVGAVAFWPLVVTHRALARQLGSDQPTGGRKGRLLTALTSERATARLRRTGAAISVVAMVWAWSDFGSAPIFLPLLFVLAAVLVGYGTWLQRFRRDESGELVNLDQKLSPEIEGIIAALLMAGLFVALTFFAQDSGRSQAQQNLDEVKSKARVSLISSTPLHLSGIREESIGEQYRSSGLTLLFSENGQHFLLPANFDPATNAKVYVVPAEGIRLDFDRSWALPCGGFEDLDPDDSFAIGERFTSAGVEFVVAAVPGSEGAAGGSVSVEELDETGNAIRLRDAIITPRFNGPYAEWLLRFVQVDEGVTLKVGQVVTSELTVTDLGESEAFDQSTEIRTSGDTAGSIRIRNEDDRLGSLGIGGSDLLIDCQPNL